ncbi:MAG: hypothetical protein II243_00850 [Lachnospiraceae bacterium]|nr:hypothetical protein [Lachnospiraceae bacterium]
MTKEELRELLEDELLWRFEEINFFKNQLNNFESENEKKKYRKSMVLILYSHLEGFIKASLLYYAQYLNGLGKQRIEFDFNLIATSMNAEFKAYDNKNSKSNLFNNKKVPNDSEIHNLYRRVNLLESSSNLLSQPLYIEDSSIDTESNLWYVVLQKNLYRLGLPEEMFSEYKGDIDGLVNRRNSIAHGKQTNGIEEAEYLKWEESTKAVMKDIVMKIYFYVKNEKYLKAAGD